MMSDLPKLSINFTCPDHPDETVISTLLTESRSPILCMECMNSLHLDMSNFLSFPKLISNASSYYDRIRSRIPKDPSSLPKTLSSFVSSQDEVLVQISQTLEAEKERVRNRINDILDKAKNVFEAYSADMFKVWDENLNIFRKNFNKLRQKYNRFYTNEDEKLNPNKKDIFEAMNNANNFTALETFIQHLQEDLLESKLVVNGEEMKQLPHLENMMKLLESQQKTLKNLTNMTTKTFLDLLKPFEASLHGFFEFNPKLTLPRITSLTNKFFSSNIIKDNAEKEQIISWAGVKGSSNLHLLYRSSRDGIEINDVKKRTSYAPNTVMVVETVAGKRFGIYYEMPKSWLGGAWTHDKAAFMFSLDDKKKFAYAGKTSNVLDDQNYFLRDNDLQIHRYPDGSLSAEAYNLDESLKTGNFVVDEIEVFQVI